MRPFYKIGTNSNARRNARAKGAIVVLEGDVFAGMETHILNFTVAKQVGEVSQKKTNVLSERGFALANHIPGHMAQFVEKSTGNAMIIATGQITYAALERNADSMLKDPSKMLDVFADVFDTFMIDDTGVLSIQFERSFESRSNSKDRSLSVVTAPVELSDIANAGIGLRIPFDIDAFHGELRIEPSFTDQSKYFVAGNIQTKSPVQISTSGECVASMIKLITERLEVPARRIYEGD